MFSIETYDEAIDHSKTVVIKANDGARSNVYAFGLACVLFVEWSAAMDYIGFWFVNLLRAAYVIGIIFYFYRASINDENTIVATDKGLYFALSKKQHGLNQFLLLEWSSVHCCEYSDGFFLRLKTKFEEKQRNNYSYKGVKLVDLKLRSASISEETYESYIFIDLSTSDARKWSKLTKTYPFSFAYI